jgi:hypothetical protein
VEEYVAYSGRGSSVEVTYGYIYIYMPTGFEAQGWAMGCRGDLEEI